MESIEQAKEELSLAREALVGILARSDLMRSREEALRSMVADAKGRMEMQPKAVEFLERLQKITHERAVGVYEELLGALVNDILPGQRDVKLDLGTERGLPALGIEIEKNGKRESILEGSGGALTNLISAGLRIIALARSGHFPFLVLDEADCWLKPSRVPQFAAVLSQISSDIGIQMLVISHHDPHYFEGLADMVALARRGGKLEAAVVGSGSGKAPVGKESKLISSIGLRDFMSHESTTIPLGPGMTCLTGENDLGKSVVAAALRAMFYGECSDAFVRHGTAKCEVEIGFGDGHRLVFEHYLKKSPKRRWRYFAPGIEEALMDASPKHGVPDWLADVAKIEKMEGLDSQLTNQKAPVFLLDQPASKRASILAIGKEASHLQKMIAKNKQKAADDARLSREGEEEIFALGRKLALTENIPEIEGNLAKLRSGLSDLGHAARRLEDGKKTLERAKMARLAIEAGDALEKIRLKGSAPSVDRAEFWRAVVEKAKAAREKSKLSVSLEIGSAPKLGKTNEGRVGVGKIKKAKELLNLKIGPEIRQAPNLKACAEHRKAAEKARKASVVAQSSVPGVIREQLSLAPTRAGALAAQKAKRLRSLREIRLGAPLETETRLERTAAQKATADLAKALRERIAKIEAWEAKRKEKEALLAEKAAGLERDLGGKCPTCKGQWSAAEIWGHNHD